MIDCLRELLIASSELTGAAGATRITPRWQQQPLGAACAWRPGAGAQLAPTPQPLHWRLCLPKPHRQLHWQPRPPQIQAQPAEMAGGRAGPAAAAPAFHCLMRLHCRRQKQQKRCRTRSPPAAAGAAWIEALRPGCFGSRRRRRRPPTHLHPHRRRLMHGAAWHGHPTPRLRLLQRWTPTGRQRHGRCLQPEVLLRARPFRSQKREKNQQQKLLQQPLRPEECLQ